MRNLLPLSCLTVLLSSAPAHAASVINWTERTGATPVSNMSTASPTVGNGSAESADGRSIYASFPTISLSTVGDKVTLSGSATLTTTVGVTSTTFFATQLRWGLYQENGTPADTLGWLGYIGSQGHNAIGANLLERNSGNTDWYMTGGGSTIVTTATAPETAFTDATYSFMLSLERTAGGIQINSSIIRSSDSQQFGLISSLDTSPLTYDFNRVGLLIGGELNADQVQFSNIDVTLVPEPRAALLGGLGTLLLLRRRRS